MRYFGIFFHTVVRASSLPISLSLCSSSSRVYKPQDFFSRLEGSSLEKKEKKKKCMHVKMIIIA